MKKRIVALMMAGAMAFSMTACGSQVKETAAKETEKKAEASTEAVQEGKEKETIAEYVFEPSKDFNIRVPFAAGGSLDTIVRIFGQGLQKTYGKTVLINNLTGANGTIAGADMESAKADATEMMAGGIAMFTLAPLFNKDVHLNLDDFQFVSGLVEEDFMLFVSPANSGVEDWSGMQEYGKNNRVVFGANTPGGTTHLLATMLFGEAGIEAEAVTSDGSAKDLLAVAGGNVVCAVATSSLGTQYVEEGSLVPIMVFSDEPYTGYKGLTVPTAKSLGYDISFKSCNFLMTKKDVNTQDVEAVHQAILDYSETDEFKELAANANYIPSLEDGEHVRKTIEAAAEMCQEAYEKYYKK